MPELPEVQTVVNDLNQLGLTGQKIIRVIIRWRRSVQGASDRYLQQRLVGQKIRQINRRGKYIVFHWEQDYALCHLRMSGRLHYLPSLSAYDKHEHVCLALSNGYDIRLHDPRKFGRFYVGKYVADRLAKLGPEPLAKDFKAEQLWKILTGHNRQLKPMLLDQSILAGMGNIYVDEALWEAQLHPQRISSSLTRSAANRLYRSICQVLTRGLKNAGTSLGEGESNFHSVTQKKGRNKARLKVYGQLDQSCLRCQKPLIRIQVAQRSTYLCPACQMI